MNCTCGQPLINLPSRLDSAMCWWAMDAAAMDAWRQAPRFAYIAATSPAHDIVHEVRDTLLIRVVGACHRPPWVATTDHYQFQRRADRLIARAETRLRTLTPPGGGCVVGFLPHSHGIGPFEADFCCLDVTQWEGFGKAEPLDTDDIWRQGPGMMAVRPVRCGTCHYTVNAHEYLPSAHPCLAQVAV